MDARMIFLTCLDRIDSGKFNVSKPEKGKGRVYRNSRL